MNIFFGCLTTILVVNSSYSQEIREIVVKNDTVYEKALEKVIENRSGLVILIQEYKKEQEKFIYKLISLKDGGLNGLCMSFYPGTNMPESKGFYCKEGQDKEWFYWNESGKLIKKEIWRKGKIIKVMKYS